MFDASFDASPIDLDTEKGSTVHGCGQGLGSSHATESGRDHKSTRKSSAKMLSSALGKSFVGALQDALGTDVDP